MLWKWIGGRQEDFRSNMAVFVNVTFIPELPVSGWKEEHRENAQESRFLRRAGTEWTGQKRMEKQEKRVGGSTGKIDN